MNSIGVREVQLKEMLLKKLMQDDAAAAKAKQAAREAAQPQETDVKTTAVKKAVKAAAKEKATERRKAAKPKAQVNARTPAQSGSKLELIIGLLKRPEGCTAKEIMDLCHWPSVSVPQQARAAKLKLRTKKEGRSLRYWGVEV